LAAKGNQPRGEIMKFPFWEATQLRDNIIKYYEQIGEAIKEGTKGISKKKF